MDRIECSVLRATVAVAMASGLVSRSARGESRLEYRVPADCPSEAAFVQAVAARGGRFDRPTAYDDGRVLEVAVGRRGEGYTGSFQARRGGVISASRDVHGTTCSEVVDALAVMVAIALRPAEEELPDEPGAGAVDSEPVPPVGQAPEPSRQRPEPTRPPLEPEPELPLKTTFSNTFPAPFSPGDKEVDVESGKAPSTAPRGCAASPVPLRARRPRGHCNARVSGRAGAAVRRLRRDSPELTAWRVATAAPVAARRPNQASATGLLRARAAWRW